jgi:hypothetical protein
MLNLRPPRHTPTLRIPAGQCRREAAVPDVAIAARSVRRLRLRTGSWLSCLASNFSSCVAAAYGRPKLASSPETEQFGRSRMPRWSVGQWKVSRRDESCSPVSKRLRASFRGRRRRRESRWHPGCLGVNSRPAEQRNFIARGVRVLLATSDVELLAGGAWRALAANREAIGDEAPQASIRPRRSLMYAGICPTR